MILEALGIVAAAAAVAQTARKGVPVTSGSIGEVGTNQEVKWRVRWAIWRWISEVQSPTTGWMDVGKFSTRELAEATARSAAQGYQPARSTLTGTRIR